MEEVFSVSLPPPPAFSFCCRAAAASTTLTLVWPSAKQQFEEFKMNNKKKTWPFLPVFIFSHSCALHPTTAWLTTAEESHQTAGCYLSEVWQNSSSPCQKENKKKKSLNNSLKGLTNWSLSLLLSPACIWVRKESPLCDFFSPPASSKPRLQAN